MLKVGRGERPARPLGFTYLDRGLTDRMWRLIEDCWEHNPHNRPNASQVLGRLPSRIYQDQTCNDGWGNLSSLRFRNSGSHGSSDREDLLVAETLRILETTGSATVHT